MIAGARSAIGAAKRGVWYATSAAHTKQRPPSRFVVLGTPRTGSENQAVADRICASLALETAPVRTDLVRTSGAGWQEGVMNSEEIAAVLATTRHASFLDSEGDRHCTPQ